ncbi:uncharacterized protein LOC126272612 isoform X2 [Schistocerca gregaria]|uniref:uncharacterized protein LOC126272612 isoform X2 n=1 Tax=Schistocerca gregaria TaxID=7010 RepID=UPI00211DD867|nr:uncharacterized protein LOC126272612 isoform X2 [Schistocerca gregaria]
MQNESLHFVYAWDTIWSDCKVLKILSVCGWESTKFHLLTVAICAAAAMNKMNRKQKGKFHSIALLLLLMTANDAASQLISTSVHHKNNDSSLEDRWKFDEQCDEYRTALQKHEFYLATFHFKICLESEEYSESTSISIPRF